MHETMSDIKTEAEYIVQAVNEYQTGELDAEDALDHIRSAFNLIGQLRERAEGGRRHQTQVAQKAY